MNKQELIERIEGLKNIFGNKCEYVKIDFVIELASELDEPEKVKVPQSVADWYEECKENLEYNIWSYIYNWETKEECDFKNWLDLGRNNPIQTLINMHQFGYEVDKEKRYLVKIKGVDSRTNYLYYGVGSKTWLFKTKLIDGNFRKSHTRKELEQDNFGWVFDSPGMEVEEVVE